MLSNVYETIQSKLAEVNSYVTVWLQYQALWDMDGTVITDRLGDDLEQWQKVLYCPLFGFLDMTSHSS